MHIFEITKERFTVIGKEGSTMDGEGFIQRLWIAANSHFDQIASLAKYDQEGKLCGIWGAMSDLSRSFQPWEDGFTKGLYLAGAECVDDAEPPQGWCKWIIPGYRYLVTENEEGAFPRMLEELNNRGLTLAGAVHDFHSPADGKDYLFFPIEKLL